MSIREIASSATKAVRWRLLRIWSKVVVVELLAIRLERQISVSPSDMFWCEV